MYRERERELLVRREMRSGETDRRLSEEMLDTETGTFYVCLFHGLLDMVKRVMEIKRKSHRTELEVCLIDNSYD